MSQRVKLQAKAQFENGRGPASQLLENIGVAEKPISQRRPCNFFQAKRERRCSSGIGTLWGQTRSQILQ